MSSLFMKSAETLQVSAKPWPRKRAQGAGRLADLYEEDRHRTSLPAPQRLPRSLQALRLAPAPSGGGRILQSKGGAMTFRFATAARRNGPC